jgi:class 3 adenylate cyclase
MSLVSVELRGWEEMVQSMPVERAQHLASDAVGMTMTTLTEMGGHEVTLEGEPWLPTMSATFEGPATSARAVRAAVAVRDAVGDGPDEADDPLKVGIGVASGDVTELSTDGSGAPLVRVLGPILETAIRLRGFAGHGQIFICGQTLAEVKDLVEARDLGGIRLNRQGEEIQAYCLTELKTPTPQADL